MNLQDFDYTLAADPSMQAPLLVQFTIEAKGAAKPTAGPQDHSRRRVSAFRRFGQYRDRVQTNPVLGHQQVRNTAGSGCSGSASVRVNQAKPANPSVQDSHLPIVDGRSLTSSAK